MSTPLLKPSMLPQPTQLTQPSQSAQPIPLPTVRNTVFGLTSLFALIVAALSAYVLGTTVQFQYYYIFSVLGIATGLLHLISVSIMMIVARARDGAFTSRLSFEVAWLSILCVLWLATGADTAAALGRTRSCGANTLCGSAQGVAALSFITCAILFGYVATLAATAVKAGQAGKDIWSSDVKQVQLAQGTVINLNTNQLSHNIMNTINSVNPNVAAAAYPPSSDPNVAAAAYPPNSDPNVAAAAYPPSSDPNYGGPTFVPQETGQFDYPQYGDGNQV